MTTEADGTDTDLEQCSFKICVWFIFYASLTNGKGMYMQLINR